jgi:polynucleotide 5'-kinase involved in rRNA processing
MDAKSEQASTSADGAEKPSQNSAPCVLVLGMAGSGKSSFVQVILIDLT